MSIVKRLLVSGGMSVALTAFPLTLGAATVNECMATPTAASHAWNFHEEANHLFQDVQADARQARDNAAQLQSFSDDYGLSWQAHAAVWNDLRANINDMSRKACRLEAIRGYVAPWQQRTIDQIAKNVQLMADSTQDAIVFGNAHQQELYNLTYQRYADNVYLDANNLTRSVGNAVEYAKVLGEYHELRSDLGVGRRAS